MRCARSRGFTLVELMVVVAIVAILMALAAPGMGRVWQTLAATQCQRHLAAIYQAQAAWRIDSGGLSICGKGWAGELLPYLERQESVLRCPSAPPLVMMVPRAAGRPGGGLAAGDCPAQPPGSERLESAFEFQVYRRAAGGAGAAGDASAPALRGELVYAIPLDSHPWVRRTQQGSAILYEVDDEGPAGGGDKPITFDDMRLAISYEDGRPMTLQVLQQACKTSPYKKYIYDFLVNGEVLVSDWVAHIGESYDLRRSAPAGAEAPDASAAPGAARRAAAGLAERCLVVPADYGLSKGTYSLPGTILGSLDPRLALALDYPKPLAEFSGEGGDEWKWDKYFIENPRRWRTDWGTTGEDWHEYQALRHFGRANVVFCDGHIESLGPEDLRPGRALWSGQGR
jgi:prepilin-type N-terminal cleavage/methylation domain-containing protein/prepilin-type processing-associated H-X9-DG protein